MRKALLGVALALWLVPTADASRLLYTSNWSGPTHIYALDPAQRAPAQLTFGVPPSCNPRPTSCGFYEPAASPNGRRIAFFDSRFCQVRLYVARANGTARREVAKSDACVFPLGVAWAPSSRRFAYSFGEGIYVADADGRASRLAAVGSAPSWSPDSRSLAYLAPSVAGRHGILTVRTGGRSRILAFDVASFAWAPSGRWVVFERRINVPFKSSVELIRADGSGGPRVLSDGYGLGRGWSADSRFVVLSGRDGLEIVDIATGTRRLLGGSYGSDHAWSPTRPLLVFDGKEGVQIYDALAGTTRLVSTEHTLELVWSPDGRSIAYVARGFATGYNSGGDLRIATSNGSPRTVVAAGGDYGGAISGLSWSKSPKGMHYRAAARRVIAETSLNQLVAPWEIQRLAADGAHVAYVSCGHVFVWTPSSRQVRQAEGIASLAPRCTVAGDYVAFQIYGLALDGNRIAYAHIQGNMGQSWSLDAGSLTATPRFSELEIRYGANGCTEGDRGLGSVVGGGGVLAYSTWRDRLAPGCTGEVIEQAIHRIDADRCPCPVISSSPGPLVPFDADAGRVLAGGENATLLLDGSGRHLQSIPVSPLAAQISGRDLVILTSGALRHFDGETGAPLHTWPVSVVSSGGECGRPHGRGWECRQPRLLLEDAARGLVAYVLDRQVHLLRLADGADAVVAAGSLARFIDSGLVYADGARLRHVPFAALPLRAF